MRQLDLSNFKTGDQIDQEIARVIEVLCQQNFACHSYEEFKTQETSSDTSAKQKYLEALEIEAATYFPIVKLCHGKYLIGTKERTLSVNDQGVLVRTGGGFMYL